MPSNFSLSPNPFSLALNGRRVAIAMGLFGCVAMVPPAMAQSTSLQSIAQREILRRTALVKTAEAQLAEGQMVLEKGEAEQAAKAFMAAYESLPEVPSTEDVRSRLRAAYSSAACIWAKNLLNEGRYADASKVIDSVLDKDMDPGNRDALRLRKQAADSDRYPPALTPKHIANVKDVTRLLTLAGSNMDLGNADKALENYRDVLRIDPYNIAARRGMEKAEQFKSRYYGAARDHTRASMLGNVDSQWEEPVPPSDKLTTMFGSGDNGSVTSTGRDVIERKLRDLKIPHVEFNNASLDEVIEYMRVTSRNIDPAGRGIDFIVNLEPEARNHPLSLNLSNVPLEELLRYITQMGSAAYRVENNAVVIGSLTERSTTMITKIYKVPPDFIQTASVDAASAPAAADPFAKQPAGGGLATGLQVRRMGAKEFLEGRGVTFPDGATANFSGGSSTLIVHNSVDNLNQVDMLVETALSSGSKQAVITVRMIDVSQTRLNELGFDWELGQFNVPGSNRVFASGGGIGNQGSADSFQSAMPAGGNVASTMVTAGLRSSGEILGRPGIDGLIAASSKAGAVIPADSRSPAQFALLGVFSDPTFQLAVRSLSQSKGVDVVSAPMITAKSGQKSSVRVVREFPYPTEFDPPQIPQNFQSSSTSLINLLTGQITSSAAGAVPITPTTPTAFTTKEVGTILEVEPVISGDGRTVELSLTPSNIEFEGFIDYGTPITTNDESSRFDFNIGFVSNGAHNTVHENHIYQPVFRNTHTTTSVNVYDGSTVVIGGLVSEKKTDINDKVPLIGDLPLVGRFWQSKVTQSEKRCVMFFVTVSVIDPSGQRVNRTAAAQ